MIGQEKFFWYLVCFYQRFIDFCTVVVVGRFTMFGV